MRLRRRLLAGAVLGLLTTVVVSATNPLAQAQEAAPAAVLGGFQGTASSSGLYSFYTPEGALPVNSVIDFGAPDALATIASGPTTFARASAADPGDLIANPDAILTLAVPDYPQGSVPPYPYRVSATSGFGEPTATSAPAPGLEATVEATPQASTARSTMPGAEAPAVGRFGSLSSLATTSTDGATVTVHVRTEVSGFKLLDVMTIDSIITDLTATSDGLETKVSGGTTVTGATVLGQAVTIGPDGIRRADEESSGPDLAGASGNLNEALASAGIRVTLAGPIQQEEPTAGQLASSGVRIDLELSDRTVPALSVLGEALNAIPPLPGLAPGAPTPDDVLVAAQARHLTRFELGRGQVSLAARPPMAPLEVNIDRPTTAGEAITPPSPSAAIGDVGILGTPAVPGAPVPVAASSPAVAASATREAPNIPLGAGVGALVLLLVLVQPFLGTRLAGLVDTVLAAGDGPCPPGATMTAVQPQDVSGDGVPADEREARLVEGADQLAEGRRSILAHPRFLLIVAATLMTTGVSVILLGWVGASHSTFVEEQVPYLISGGLLGVALALIGALTLVAHWLTIGIREAREHEAARRRDHTELVDVLRSLAPPPAPEENSNGRTRGEQAQRPLRRAPRSS